MTDSNPGSNAAVDELANAVEWSFRSYREGDIPAIVALTNAIDDAYNLGEGTSDEELQSSFSSPRSDPARQVVIVDGPRLPGLAPGALPGYGRVTYEDDEGQGERSYFMDVLVHPAAEGRGLERQIVERLFDIIKGYEGDTEIKPMQKAVVKAWGYDNRHPLRALYSELGLGESRYFWTMARDLTEPVDEPAPVEGVNIRPYRVPDDNKGALQAFNDSFSDHWDHHPVSQADWDHWTTSPGMRFDLSLLAEVQDAPGTFGGFCICGIYESSNKRRGVCEGWIDLLGTTREWRRKGLGRALLLHGLHSLRSAGMDTALLGVDSESPTGANRLYESVGFRTRRRGISYGCDLDQVRL